MSEGKLELVSDITDYTQATSFDPATANFDPNTFGVEPVDTPSDTSEVGELPDGGEAKPDAPIVPAETPKEPEAVTIQPKPEAPAPVEEKKYDPLSELGFVDEKDRSFVSKLVEAYKEGSLHEFMDKGSKDYNKISDADILKMEILKQYPKADDDVLDKLYLKKLKEFGFTQGEDESEDAVAEKMMKLHTDQLREEAQREQEKYRATSYEKKPSEADLKAQKDWEDFNKSIDEDESFAEFGRNKVYAFDDFNVEVPSDIDIKAYAKNPSLFLSKFFKEDGKMDSKAFQEFILCGLKGRKGYADAVAFGESKATKKHHDSLRGVDADKTPAQPAPVVKGKLEKV